MTRRITVIHLLACSVCILLGVSASNTVAQEYPAICDDSAHYPQFQQLDYWVGSWRVYAGDKQVADVSVEHPKGSCAYLEKWSGLPSNLTAGRPSVSYALVAYDASEKVWNYYWVTGVIGLHFHFTASPGPELTWVRKDQAADGKVTLQRLKLSKLPDGTLQEQGTSSADNGATWSKDYTMMWHRK